MRLNTLLLSGFFVLTCALCVPASAEMQEQPVVKLRSLDKVTARTMTFEARVGTTVKFGSIYIKVQACRKAEPIDTPESASFLQIWEVNPQGESKWIFSGWMFASSPALSPMDHPIYDVWVLDCLERKSSDPVPEEKKADNKDKAETAKDEVPPSDVTTDGEVTGPAAEPPKDTPPKPVVEMPEGYDLPVVETPDQTMDSPETGESPQSDAYPTEGTGAAE